MLEWRRMKQIELQGECGKIRGMLHEAASTRVAVIVGGQLASNRIGPNRLYFQIASVLSRRGWNVLRVDLSGLGESDARLEDVSFQDHIRELTRVCDWCVSMGLGRPHLVAHCAGSFTAMDCASERPDLLNTLLLLAPFIRTRESLLNLMPLEPNWREIGEQGWTFRKGVFFHQSFAEASRAMSFPATAGGIPMDKLRIIIAREDELTPWETSERWARDCEVPYDLIDGADHNFSAVGPRDLLLRSIVSALSLEERA